MKILLCVKNFSIDEKSSWLTDDICQYFDETGYGVHVLFLDVKGNAKKGIYKKFGRTTVYCYPLSKNRSKVIKVSEIIGAWVFFLSNVRKIKPDFILNFTMFSFFSPVVCLLRVIDKRVHIAGIVWDFYPFHFIDIGKMKNGIVSSALYYLEKREFLSANSLYYMSDANRRFSEKYFPGVEKIPAKVLGLWRTNHTELSRRKDVRKESAALHVMFGGQLTNGRGVDQILDAAKLTKTDTIINIIGGGSEFSAIESRIYAENIVKVNLRSSLPREQYIDELSKCDLGLVVTVPGNTVSFPSKYLDYVMQAIPIVVSVEETSDFSEFVTNVVGCGISCKVGDPVELARVLDECFSKKNELVAMGNNGYEYYLRNLQTKTVARKIKFKVDESFD